MLSKKSNQNFCEYTHVHYILTLPLKLHKFNQVVSEVILFWTLLSLVYCKHAQYLLDKFQDLQNSIQYSFMGIRIFFFFTIDG